MKKMAYKKEAITFNFPGLIHPVRQKAINDNRIPMLSVIIKHSALMSLAFFALYLIHIFA